MTYKYLYVRRAIYEENPVGKLSRYRNWSDMARLFKLPYWIMLGVLLISIVFLILIAIYGFNSPLMGIPVILIVSVVVLTEILREKYLFNDSVRATELSERMQNYELYVTKIKEILRNHGIDTPEKIAKLKAECETALKMREEKFAKINSKIVDMLIGVPLGALIASIIYAGNDAIPAAIGSIIIIGIAVLGVIQIIRKINYYSDGYFKDRYLLDAINELDYSIEGF